MSRVDVFFGDGHIVDTPQGNRTVHTDDDLLNIIGENCGREVQELVDELLEDLCEEQIYEKERAQTDAESFEASCEEYRNMLLDVQEFIDKILKDMDEHPRLKKDTIYNELSRIPKKINTIL